MSLQAGDIARWWYAKNKEWGNWLLIIDKDSGKHYEEEKLYCQLTVMHLGDGYIDSENWWEGAEGGHWEVA